ncbi:molecular chaperone [Klebsiella aerogenes]|uniref:fimbrial biogenesis chaperone n=1 Tax=Klebsiella aerogenes TaxID=548 RepID=UPI000F7E416E|nr:molecular chaperone [Klebsiella aerogenes]RSV97760.1 molecular chaperone [Klebsiella aerogenes]
MHIFFNVKKTLCFILYSFILISPSWGKDINGISFNFTRLVMTDKDTKGVYFKAYNNNDFPILVQSWGSKLDTDTGSVDDSTSDIKIPFIVLPPLQRVEPGEEFTLHLRFNGERIPSITESVYLLSFKAIPVSGPKTAKTLSMTVVMNIKVFIRNQLPDNDGISSAINKVTASWHADGVLINNPSPYWLTLSSIILDNKEIERKELLKMAAPMQSTLFKWKNGRPREIFIKFIDEYSMETETVRLKIE